MVGLADSGSVGGTKYLDHGQNCFWRGCGGVRGGWRGGWGGFVSGTEWISLRITFTFVCITDAADQLTQLVFLHTDPFVT